MYIIYKSISLMNKHYFFLALYFFTSLTVFAQSAYQVSGTDKLKLDSIAIQDVPANAPGITTAIIKNGQLIYEKYAGYGDLKDSTLITRETRFNIASNGKQFTALAILTLLDKKKINLYDDIRKFFPSLFPFIKDKISVRSLLNHTSGIRDCYDLWSLQGFTWWKKTFSNEDVLKLIENQQSLNFKPDTRYLYSNTNYILLALLIEKITKKDFITYTNELFSQLNMPNTSFENDYHTIKGPVARAYFNFGTWTTYNWIWNVCGDGNIFSTMEDQIQWEKIIQGTGSTSIKKELIAKSQEVMEGSSFKNYGYGLEFGQYKGLPYKFHEGATGAWKATVTRFPAQKISIITLTNTGKSIPGMQTRQMADVVLGLKKDISYWLTQPQKEGAFVSEKEILGIYSTENDFTFRFENVDGKILLKRIGRNDVELVREATNIFHQKYDPAFKQEFTRNKNGSLQVTAYYTSHAPYSLTKQSADFTGFDYTSFDGNYLNSETSVEIDVLYLTENRYRLIFGKSDTATGILITPAKLLVKNYSISIPPKQKAIDSFLLNGDRIKKIKFIKRRPGF